MGFRFRKSINLGKGFRINLSKSGIGGSWGVKGLRFTRTAKGKTRATVSLPGTGLSYSTELGGKKKKQKDEEEQTRRSRREEDERPIGDEEMGGEPPREDEEEGMSIGGLLLLILLWFLTISFAILAAVNIPETVGFVALAAAAVMLPIGIWQDLLSRFIPGWLKVIAAVALMAVTLVMGPFGGFEKLMPPEETTAAATTEAEVKPAEPMDYVLNTASMKFHYPDCNSVRGTDPKNREDVHTTRDELINKDYSPCGRCKP